MSRIRLILAAALLTATWGAPRPAQAHALLRHASPGAGATLRAAPQLLSMEFSEGIEPAFSSITVVGAGGRHFEQGKPHVLGGDPTHVAIDLLPLPPGTYDVTWRATSVDTHKTQGNYQFSVTP
jgi:methionine-rich copper-binding protein CopC